MMEDPSHEFYSWIIVPSIAAFGAVLGVELSFVLGALGSEYDATIVWDAWGEPAETSFFSCEIEMPDKFVRRPISAVFSVSYIFAAIVITAFTMVDFARSPARRNLRVMAEREPVWGLILALGPLSIGASTFLAFASGRLFLFEYIQWFWWCTLSSFAAYLWARFIYEAFRLRSFRYWRTCCAVLSKGKRHSKNVSPQEDTEDAENYEGDDEITLSISSVFCLVCVTSLDLGLFLLKDAIIENRVQELLVFLLLLSSIIPAALHWKLRRNQVHSSWWRLCFSAALGVGSFAVLYGDMTASLCPSGFNSAIQPYAGFQFLSSLAILAAYAFVRGDRHQHEYTVIVQAEHSHGPNGVVSAFFVPADDPYSGRRSAVAQAVPDSANIGGVVAAPASASTRSMRADSSGSNSSANDRRRSSAYVADGQPAASGVGSRPGRNSTIQEVAVGSMVAGGDGSRRNTPAGRIQQPGRTSITVDDPSSPTLFTSSNRVEGSTSSRTSQESSGVVAGNRGSRTNQQLKPRPPGALMRDTSTEFDRSTRPRPVSLERNQVVAGSGSESRQTRPLSLDRSFDPASVQQQGRPQSVDRRVSATAAGNAGGRPRVNSTERRLEPRPRPVERGPSSSAQSPPNSDMNSSRGSLTSAPVRGGGRPASASFDSFTPAVVTAPIVSSVPVAQSSPASTPRSSVINSVPAASSTPRTSMSAIAASSAPRNSLAAAAAPTGITRGSIVSNSRPSAGSFDSTLGAARGSIQMNNDGIPVIVARSKGESRLSGSSVTSSGSISRPSPPAAPQVMPVAPVPPVPPVPPNFMIPGPPPITTAPGVFVAPVSVARPSYTGSMIPPVPPPGLNVPPNASRAASITVSASGSGMLQQQPPSQPRRTTQPPGEPRGRPSLATEPPTDTMRRPAAGSMDSVGSRGPIVPGRPRRSSVDKEEHIALRVLQTGAGAGGRSIEREREILGQGVDMRKVALRTPEEAREASRRLSVVGASDSLSSPSPGGAPSGASLSTAERLAALRAERMRLEQTKEALQARSSTHALHPPPV